MSPRGVPSASSPEARHRLERQRRENTNPEMKLRRVLFARGHRYRVHMRVLQDLRRRMDIVFPKQRVVVMIDGCYWHGCPQHATWPKANAEWWKTKLESNRKRDRDTDKRLRAAGWHVVRVWEHEDAATAAIRVEASLG